MKRDPGVLVEARQPFAEAAAVNFLTPNLCGTPETRGDGRHRFPNPYFFPIEKREQGHRDGALWHRGRNARDQGPGGRHSATDGLRWAELAQDHRADSERRNQKERGHDPLEHWRQTEPRADTKRVHNWPPLVWG